MSTTKNVEIGIFNVGRTEVDKEEVKRWLEFIGANEFEIPDDETITNPALLVALASKRCYMSFEVGLNPNITKVRKDYSDYLDNILNSGHGSVLEHAVYTFAIENVSRVFTGEMNRHRAGWAISEGSQRFIRFGEAVPYWVPSSIRDTETDDTDLRQRKVATREIFARAFDLDAQLYRELEAVWDMDASHHNFSYKKKVTSMMRRIIGMGVATGGVWTGNIRALRHVLTMRCSEAAEEEILYVFSRIAKMMKDREPMMFGDFYQDDKGYWRPKYVKV